MKHGVIVLLGLVLAACGSPEAGSEQADDTEPGGGTIGEGYVDALDRAEAVDALAGERKDRLDEAVDGADQRR